MLQPVLCSVAQIPLCQSLSSVAVCGKNSASLANSVTAVLKPVSHPSRVCCARVGVHAGQHKCINIYGHLEDSVNSFILGPSTAG